jgi:hypothetical protein
MIEEAPDFFVVREPPELLQIAEVAICRRVRPVLGCVVRG